MTVVLQGYLCKFCELFCGHSSSSQGFVTVGIKFPVLASTNTGKYFNMLFRIMQLCDIFIFNFKTQLAIICVFHFINCFPFLFPKRCVTIVNVTSETTNSNSLLPNTTSNDIQQHVNSGDVGNDSQSDCHIKISMAV
jgi:hypothetical protein